MALPVLGTVKNCKYLALKAQASITSCFLYFGAQPTNPQVIKTCVLFVCKADVNIVTEFSYVGTDLVKRAQDSRSGGLNPTTSSISGPVFPGKSFPILGTPVSVKG